MTFKEEYGEVALEDYGFDSELQGKVPSTKGRSDMKPLTEKPLRNSVVQEAGLTVKTVEQSVKKVN